MEQSRIPWLLIAIATLWVVARRHGVYGTRHRTTQGTGAERDHARTYRRLIALRLEH
jgi:hypothetical protein